MYIDCLEKYKLRNYRGIRSDYLEALRAKNILTVTEFLMRTPDEVMRITYMDHNEYEKFVDEIFARCRPNWMPVTSAVVMTKGSVPTGIKCLDKILDGGLRCGEMLEFYGPPRSGKSQMCIWIAAHVVLQLNASVAYLDAKNDFSPTRYQEICTAHINNGGGTSGSVDESLENLHLFRGSKFKDAQNFLYTVEQRLRGSGGLFTRTLKLIVIDSLPMILYPCTGSSDGSSRIFQEYLAQNLKRIAETYNLVVIVTNHAVADQKDSKTRSSTGRLRSALGQYWMNVPNFRILFSETGKSGLFTAEFTHGHRIGEGKTFHFTITNSGVT